MADPFLAEIRMFPFSFAPRGWAFCDGQLLPLSQNTALFSLIGTYYGGDGKSNFALPNMQGSAPMHPGQGAGLSLFNLGEASGTPTVALLESEIPLHTHSMRAHNADPADAQNPSPATSLAQSSQGNAYNPATNSLINLAPETLAPAGGGQPHNNMMPYLTLSFCIALQGVYPPRT